MLLVVIRICCSTYKEYWLLDDIECKGLVKVSLKSDMQPANGNDAPANGNMQAIKESKVNIEDIGTAAPDTPFGNKELEQVFQFFLTCRQRNGDPLLSDQIQGLREELRSVADTDAERIAAARKAAVSGWKSFYPIRKRQSSGKSQPAKSKNKFNNFQQREYDYNKLEAQLLGVGGNGHEEIKV